MPADNDNSLLVHYLTEQGLSWPEIEQVLKKLDEHDKQMMHESVFDSIERGTFSLDDIINESREAG